MIQRRGSTLDYNQNDIKKHLLRAVYYNLPKFIKAFKIPRKKKKKRKGAFEKSSLSKHFSGHLAP